MGNWAKQARTAYSDKDFTKAGDFYKLDGDYRAAVKAYQKGGHYAEAAKIYEETGQLKKAEKLLAKHGSAKDKAEFHLRNGNPTTACEIYLNNDMDYEAAELYESQNQLNLAAALYHKLGFNEKAGVLYGKTKNFDKAIECFSIVVRQLESSTNSNTMNRIFKYNAWIANLHIGAKRFNQAGEIFERIHQKEKAAKCYIKGNRPVRAAELMMQLNKNDMARQLLSGQESRESRILLGRLLIEDKKYEEAVTLLRDTEQYELLAQAYDELGRYKDAAWCQEKLGNLVAAASMYARAQDHQRAAILYEQNGQFEEAAQSYEKQKKFGNAAKLYHMARNRYKSGLCLYRLNRLEDALKQLQMVEEDDPHQLDAKTIMAEIFFKQGVYSVARKLLEELTMNTTLSEASMSTFYLLARCLEEENDLVGAKSYYDRIVARKFDYADVRRRLQSLQNKITPAGPKAAAPVKSPMDMTTGDIIADRFRILSTIGKGGMGCIFHVRDLSLDREIALKMLLGDRANFEELKGELLIARDLTHPYIIKVFDVGIWNKIGYFTMEFVEGQMLKKYILSTNDPIEKQVGLLIKICEGLKAAHDQQVVHRDIKPQNILIDHHYNPKVLDFGIARKVEPGVKKGSISGSPKYMAPEQIQNTTTDLRTDIYAMGIIMFYMATKKEPFVAKTPQEVMMMHLRQPLPEPFEYNNKLPFWLCDIIKRCCQKNPDSRFSDMAELIEELRMNTMELG